MNASLQPLKSIFLADDDPDDRLLFEEALKEIDNSTELTMAHDGEHLMTMLGKHATPRPNVIFLDLNMPRKNGLECLKEIKQTAAFKDIPVVVFSTSCQQNAISQMYEHGASYYICKPDSFQKLKKSLSQLFSLDFRSKTKPPLKDFVIAL